MLYDYLFAGGLPQHPMQFAQTFYDHYPKVALGHYPPGFYLLSAFWMLLCGTHWNGLILLLGLLSTLLATLVFLLAARLTHPVFALLISLLFTCIPLQQRYNSLLMSDHLLSLLILLAALAFGHYATREKPSWTLALTFGLLSAAAILTKAGGIVLALIPPAVILITGRWTLLKTLSLWASALTVAILCAPWFLFTAAITEEGMAAYSPAYHLNALTYYLNALPANLGRILMLPLITGYLWLPLHLHRVHNGPGLIPGIWAAILALPPCLLAIYVALPTGLDDRYWLPALPSLILIIAAGLWLPARALAAKFFPAKSPDSRHSPTLPIATALFALFTLGFTFTAFRVPPKIAHGYAHALTDSTHALTDSPGPIPQGSRILISSDARGEGAVIAQAAFLDHKNRSLQILRASKELAETDWMAADYQLRAQDTAQMAQLLHGLQLKFILFDNSLTPRQALPHHQILRQTLTENLDQPAGQNPITVYPLSLTPIQRRGTPKPSPTTQPSDPNNSLITYLLVSPPEEQ
jgi:4-amino-4-deoxy-L-arabinose transferase-like glycosyltransferase